MGGLHGDVLLPHVVQPLDPISGCPGVPAPADNLFHCRALASGCFGALEGCKDKPTELTKFGAVN